MWKNRQKHDHHFYGKIAIFFRQINGFTKEMISRKFLSVIAFYSIFPHCENYNDVFSRNFSSESKIRVFFHTVVGKLASKDMVL